jgi:hypothetical protein
VAAESKCRLAAPGTVFTPTSKASKVITEHGDVGHDLMIVSEGNTPEKYGRRDCFMAFAAFELVTFLVIGVIWGVLGF